MLQVQRVAGYLLSFPDARVLMAKLEIPDRELANRELYYPINDWLAKTKRRGLVCSTLHRGYDCGFEGPEGVLLITHIRAARRSESAELLVERDQDKYVKKWLVEEGGAREESMRWMSFPDEDEFSLLIDGPRPRRNRSSGPPIYYEFTLDQIERQMESGKNGHVWAAEARANGEVVKVGRRDMDCQCGLGCPMTCRNWTTYRLPNPQ